MRKPGPASGRPGPSPGFVPDKEVPVLYRPTFGLFAPMIETIYRFGALAVTGGPLLAAGAALLLAILLLITFFAWRGGATVEMLEETRSDGIEAGLAEIRRHQGEITGHVRGLSERLDGFGHRVGQSMSETARGTHENLSKLGERLAVIDKAQQTITSLWPGGRASAYPRQQADARRLRTGRMEAIVRDGLPIHAYAFQYTLPNGTRADCVIFFPTGPESRHRRQVSAGSVERHPCGDVTGGRQGGGGAFRRDTLKHVQDIVIRYFVPGETRTPPPCSRHRNRFRRPPRTLRGRCAEGEPGPGYRRLSSMLMLSIQVVMSLMRDQRIANRPRESRKKSAR